MRPRGLASNGTKIKDPKSVGAIGIERDIDRSLNIQDALSWAGLSISYQRISMRNVLLTTVAPICTVFGGLISLVLARQPLSISAVVGFVSVVGISTFHTCILITHYMEVYREKKNKEEATFETVRDKFRPVLMVGLVASLGLLPASLAHGVGSQVQKPLAIVVVGGMLIGTGIILLVMPLLFRFVHIKK